MMYCRPYLYVRCTWPGLSCTHVRIHITHGCGVPVGMIEGREKEGSRRTGIFRPVDLSSLFSGLYVIGSRTLLILFGALLGCNAGAFKPSFVFHTVIHLCDTRTMDIDYAPFITESSCERFHNEQRIRRASIAIRYRRVV